MEIIIPAAGLSTRFPLDRPKYTLSDYTGLMMWERAVEPFIRDHNITIGLLQENEEKFSIAEYIKEKYQNSISVVILDNRTTGPADTVYQIIKKQNLNLDQEILIKDCDSFFNHTIQSGNYVCVSDIKHHEIIKRLSSKSFVISNDQGIINNIVEKKVVSEKFCVGGYKFETARIFVEAFEKLKKLHVDEIFVSHIIEECLNRNLVFKESLVEGYVDVGTIDEWREHNNRCTLFIDIDGTIIRAQKKSEYVFEPIPLKKNVDFLLKLQDKGNELIFTTARPSMYDVRTREILDKLGFKNYRLISGLLNAKRILINDYNESNIFPRAEAVNIQRNTDTLPNFIPL